ncbi:DUF6274 family protein [Streptomyces atratus]|uniref:Uncharacterized protein n=1 Tax=Streptomyces atratus TaxID=1893 RepID=A0A2Z5JFL2_STRAR|nr:DUF6274 family protein [Streptomyces atratus]AXE79131.1 hypothetical protein C5746_21850 [Streptomyces atratus]
MTASTGHETRALLSAHLAAASGYHHLTHRCPICHRLLRLVMEPVTASRIASPPEPPVQCAGRQDGALEGQRARRARRARTKVPRPGDQWRGIPLPEGGRLVLGKAHAV